MTNLFPNDLPSDIFSMLTECQNETQDVAIESLREEASVYLSRVKTAYEMNPLIVNLPLAEALHGAIECVVKNWDSIPTHAQSWCKAMIRYFTRTSDGDHDFNSPLGFDDDAEVINSCLKFAGLDAFCVDPEEVDNA